MSGVLKAIKKLIKKAIDFVGDFLDKIWKAAVDYIIEPVMNFLGFKDQKIVDTKVIATKVFNENLLEKTRTELSVKRVLDGQDILEYNNAFAQTGDRQFREFFMHGKNDYIDYLPSAQIDAYALNTDSVKTVLDAIHGQSVTIIDVEDKVPSDELWCKWLLQERYGYDIGRNLLIDQDYYCYQQQEYNTSDGTFTVTLQTIPNVTKYIYENTEVIVDTLDDTTDLVITSTYTEEMWYRTDTMSYLGTNTSDIETTEEEVPTGTVIGGFFKTLVDTVEETVNSTTKSFILEYHKSINYIIARYSIPNVGIRYWIYDTQLALYPELDAVAKQVVDLEMYPVVMLRNSHFNVTDYDKDKVNGKKRPPSVTEERYKDTVEILGGLGLDLHELTQAYSENGDIADVKDAFFLLGVSPSDTSPAVSKALWEIFSFIYDKMPYSPMQAANVRKTQNVYACSFREDPFNAAMTWRPSVMVETDEVIGCIGTHKHVVSTQEHTTKARYHYEYEYLHETGRDEDGKTYKHNVTSWTSYEIYRNNELIGFYTDKNSYKTSVRWLSEVRTGPSEILLPHSSEKVKEIAITKQITETKTQTMFITNFSAFNIIRRYTEDGGGVTLYADNKNLVIPLPVDVVERLSLMDRTEILGCAAYLVFYAYKEKTIKWYEGERFGKFLQIIMIVIVIIIIILSWGTLSWTTEFWLALGKVLTDILIATAVSLALKVIAKNVSNTTLKMVLSAAAMAVGAWAGGMTFDLSWTTAFFLTSVCAYAADLYIGDKMEDLQNDIESFKPKAQKRLQEQEDLLKELNEGISTSQITDWVTDIGQTSTAVASLMLPDQFFYIAKGDASRNFDMLYTGLYDSSVHSSIDNMKRIGFLIGE